MKGIESLQRLPFHGGFHAADVGEVWSERRDPDRRGADLARDVQDGFFHVFFGFGFSKVGKHRMKDS